MTHRIKIGILYAAILAIAVGTLIFTIPMQEDRSPLIESPISQHSRPQSYITLPPSESPLVRAIQNSATEFEIPDRLLLAVAYYRGKFRGGKCETPPTLDFSGEHPPLDFGPFALTKEEVEQTSRLLNQDITLEQIICNVTISTRAQAALLQEFAKSYPPENLYDPLDWRETIFELTKQRFPNLTEDVQQDIVARLFDVLRQGQKGTDAWRNEVVLPPLSPS